MLLVRALTADWVPAAADILTESFASALGAVPYTNFLRRQVKAYLEQHLHAGLQVEHRILQRPGGPAVGLGRGGVSGAAL